MRAGGIVLAVDGLNDRNSGRGGHLVTDLQGVYATVAMWCLYGRIAEEADRGRRFCCRPRSCFGC
jgi:hypothetical protein